MLSNRTIGQRLLLLVLVSVISLVALSVAGLLAHRESLFADRRVKTQNVVEVASSVINHYVQLAEAGEISQEEAQASALADVEALRYEGESNYFWVHDHGPTMLMHALKPQLNGQDISGAEDTNGVPLFVEMVAVVEAEGSGFVAYDWQNPGEEAPRPKISFVQGIPEWGWIVGSGIYVDDVNAVFWNAAVIAIGAIVTVLAVMGGVAWSIGRGISLPIRTVTERMDQLATGNLEIEVPFTERKDEVGGLARSLAIFKDNALKMEEMRRVQAETEQRASADRHQARLAMADDLETSVKGMIESLGSASTELSETARAMTGIADTTSQKAVTVATGSEETSQSVQTVAAATEELNSSVGEIGRQITTTAGVSADAVEKARSANDSVKGLSEASEKIGEVVQLIASIAEQTNLLALNATIEAARAGDAGKGFAVVASEVKALADQTAKATDEIGQQIQSMQSATASTVNVIGEIGEVIDQISASASAVAAAIEQQTAATQEIARNIEQAASGADTVTRNISDVSQAAGQTGDSAGVVLESSEQLSRISADVGREVDAFLAKIRAA